MPVRGDVPLPLAECEESIFRFAETLTFPIPNGQELRQRWRCQLSAGIALLEPDNLSDGRVLRRWRVQDKTNVAHS